MSVTALFVGPDDSETCDTGGLDDDGCEGAVNGNPYTLDTVPEPGDFACMSRCRHMVQIDGDAPDDVPTMDWSSSAGFVPSGAAADAQAKYYGDEDLGGWAAVPDLTADEAAISAMEPDEIAQYLADHDLDLSDVEGALTDDEIAEVRANLQDMGVIDGDTPDSTTISDALDAANVDTASQLIRDGGEDEARALAQQGFDDADSSQAYYLAEALNDATSGDWNVEYDGDGHWYVRDRSARVQESVREAGPSDEPRDQYGRWTSGTTVRVVHQGKTFFMRVKKDDGLTIHGEELNFVGRPVGTMHEVPRYEASVQPASLQPNGTLDVNHEISVKNGITKHVVMGKYGPSSIYHSATDFDYKHGHVYEAGPTDEPRDEHGMWTSGSMTINYLHNNEKAPNFGSRFGQDVEPKGRYLVHNDANVPPPKGWEAGTVTFNNPLHIDFDGGYQDDSNWKQVLSKRYGGKRGAALSRAIMADGYDAIVTHDKYGTSEIVHLTAAPKREAGPPDEARDDHGKWTSGGGEEFPGERVSPDTYRIGKAEVSLRQYREDDVRDGSPAGTEIRSIKVPSEDRRQGHAAAAMQQIADWADRTKTIMYLWADPFDDKPMNASQLGSFYRKFGFKTYVGRIMQRKPVLREAGPADEPRDEHGRWATQWNGEINVHDVEPMDDKDRELAMMWFASSWNHDAANSAIVQAALNVESGRPAQANFGRKLKAQFKNQLDGSIVVRKDVAFAKAQAQRWSDVSAERVPTLYRGVHGTEAEQMLRAKVGDEVEFPPLLSATPDFDTSLNFMELSNSGKPFVALQFDHGTVSGKHIFAASFLGDDVGLHTKSEQIDEEEAIIRTDNGSWHVAGVETRKVRDDFNGPKAGRDVTIIHLRPNGLREAFNPGEARDDHGRWAAADGYTEPRTEKDKALQSWMDGYKQLMELHPDMKNTHPMYAALLEKGRFFQAQTLPAQYKVGTPQNCFQDAWKLAMVHHDLTYCEGEAMNIIPVHHAWCVDKEGRVIDPTWSSIGDTGEHAYFGVKIPNDELSKRIMQKKTYGYF